MPLSAFLCAFVLLAAALVPATAAPLAAEQWNKRIVLIFGGEGGAGQEQADALLADRDALAEREVVIVTVLGNRVATPFGSLARAPDAGELRMAYGVEDGSGLTTILLGKDGGEKLRRGEPVAAEEIFALIDSMPMRQNEMKKR